ncbi:MAG TPA: hypothetical protein VIN62_01310 [Candidatus Cryosericum sp.]|jgi:cell division protein FtsL|nr:hypothetical protein [Candidatus Cryosericum sp.]
MSIAIKGNYTAVRRPAAAVRVSAEARTRSLRVAVLAVTIIGLLCAYGYVYSTTLFLQHQVDLNRAAIQAQLQQQEVLLEQDASLTSPDRVRAAADALGLTPNNTAVIGTLDNTIH